MELESVTCADKLRNHFELATVHSMNLGNSSWLFVFCTTKERGWVKHSVHLDSCSLPAEEMTPLPPRKHWGAFRNHEQERERVLVENLHLWGNSSDRCSEERLLKRSKERYITVEVTLRNVFPCTHLAQEIYAVMCRILWSQVYQKSS